MGPRNSILAPFLRLLAFCAIAAVIFAPLLGASAHSSARYEVAARDGLKNNHR